VRAASIAALGALLCACPPPADTGLGPLPEGPVLTHTPAEGPLMDGDSLTLSVQAEDEDGVAGVRAYFRTGGWATWDWVDLQVSEDGDGTWSADVFVADPQVEYYFKATDDGTPQAVSYLPEDGAMAPFGLDVLASAQTLPFTEDFEYGEGEDSLRDLGWIAYQAAFPGYPWDCTEGGRSGQRVRHALGTGDPDDLMDDWLIAPALDLSSADTVGLSWYEEGTAVDLADHSLWISTGSRDPSAGEFQEVQALAAPGTDWARAPVVDLSAWAGERVVYLAWRYQGADADTWSIDDVQVTGLAADLSMAIASSPSPVHPGEEVTLEVTVTNAVDVPAEGVWLSLDVDMGAGGVVEESDELGGIDGLGSVVGSFTFTLAESLTDNTVLPCTLTLESVDGTWTEVYDLQLGHPSTAALDLTLDAFALVQVSFGVGDPDAPTWEGGEFYGTLDAGATHLEADVTAQNDLLPPAAGEHRWFARVLPYTSGSVTGFGVSWNGEDHQATTLPALSSGVESIVWLPDPPEPSLSSWATSPSTVTPGLAGVSFSYLSLYNGGAATSGPVTATLESVDPDVTLLDGGPVEVSTTAWPAGAFNTLSGVFAFDVSAAHVDSQPLAFTMVLDDGVERFELPLSVPVPWPVLTVTRVDVDDSAGGDGDGVLDPDEAAILEVTVANTGDLDTDGIVRGSLTLLPTGTASAEVESESHSFGSISTGRSRSEEFAITVAAGGVGDTLDLRLELYDSTTTFAPSFGLVLGEPPWLAASAVDDSSGDALGGYAFDFTNAWYRMNGGLMELRLASATGFDPATAFVEGWGASAGAGYVLYQLVIQGGTADLLGWPDYGSHVVIASPTLATYGTDELLVTWDPTVMDLALDQFSMGFGAGWCGPPTYYCDSFPDAWGYPYEGYDSGMWLDFTW